MTPCRPCQHADHAHNADHRDSADHGDNGHQFLEEMVQNMLLHFNERNLQYSDMQIYIYILIFL